MLSKKLPHDTKKKYKELTNQKLIEKDKILINNYDPIYRNDSGNSILQCHKKQLEIPHIDTFMFIFKAIDNSKGQKAVEKNTIS